MRASLQVALIALALLALAGLAWFALRPGGAGGAGTAVGPDGAAVEPGETTAPEFVSPGRVQAPRVAGATTESPDSIGGADELDEADGGPELHRLRGHVVDDFGLGVEGLLVFLSDVEASSEVPLESTTDAEGAFDFDGLERGRYALLVDERSVPEGQLAGPELELDVPAPDGTFVRLLRAGAVEGYVRWPDGAPVEGATVRAGHRWGSLQGVSDATGRYRIEGLRPGGYAVRVVDLPALGRPTSYPRPIEVELAEGAVHQVADLVLALGSASVSGRVLDDRGRPLAGLPVACFHGTYAPGSNSERDPAGTDVTNANGEFLIEELAAGEAHVIPAFGRKAFVGVPVPVQLVEGEVARLPDQRLASRGTAGGR